ncbi:hypothetical protein CIRG_02296 [Coccidioides immitis RMSCC 2394]|uniref:Uncharacterized protein n=1 Tax=Coccidioides immitis RMSCC 2394 TaxID=404692 RepID=A0A0J6Y6F7_COCIT|nr:hypothetical protein CIRG_02296 [Coccidioides immitis RMSCC 2394]
MFSNICMDGDNGSGSDTHRIATSCRIDAPPVVPWPVSQARITRPCLRDFFLKTNRLTEYLQRGPWEGDGGETGQRDGHQGSHVLSLAGGVTKDQLSLQSAFRVSFLKASVGNLSSYTASKNPRGSQGV